MNNEQIRQHIMQGLQWRYATKQFDSQKKIPAADWSTLLESLRLAPSSYGLQPWQFLVVENPKVRQELRAVSWNQTQVTDASHFVVIAYKESMSEEDIARFIGHTAKVRSMDVNVLNGYRDMMIGDLVKGPRSSIINFWAQRQSYIAMGFLMETAALLSIDTCPLEGLDPAAYDKILKLENSGYKTVAAVACGYRHADDKYQSVKKVRYDQSDVIKVI